MDTKWEINRVSTRERIFSKIKTEMPQPVGIMIFGADGELKEQVVRSFTNALQGFATFHSGAPDTATLVAMFEAHRPAVVTLNADESSSHSLRHELVKVMQNAGAASVVGVYAKARPHQIRPLASSKESVQLNKQIAAIERSQPSADGLDYLVVVNESI